jgi:hypothetical protein
MAGVRLLIVGSWTRMVITAALLLAFWLVIAWLAATGRLADLRYVNVPLVHPYPRAGYVQNPFNPSDKGDVISASDAARVKADLLHDGQLELRALELGDTALLNNAAIGRARERLSALIAQNNAAGLFEREQIKFDAIIVGRLPDPNDPSIAWMVEERGIGTIFFYSKSSNALVKQQSVKFTSRFWLVKIGDRYLIADALVRSEPLTSQ